MKDTDTYGFARELADMYSPAAYEEGETKGETKALVSVLEARDLPVSDEIAEKIVNCPDNETLLTWLRRAAVATSVDEVFGD
ncbi:hypothetical protein AB0J52_14130 [Spirillospora sp. NPDC049652]